MIIIMCTGLFFILLSAIVNLIEIQKFLKALNMLNSCTKTIMDRVLYPYRLLRLFPLLSPLVPDIICVSLALLAGIGGGMMLSILTVGGTCIITLGIKLFMRLNKKETIASPNFEVEYAKLKAL